ncbi:cytochrome oxidase small assembly protein [Cupriavidus sp. AU9028]|nr:cytochrome oxidase small assembly protein [Cupriavidus sp. AU9028]MBY4896558.1 cytochrome oxidase small assembly protein [Cupriavidus sp. AU9028]
MQHPDKGSARGGDAQRAANQRLGWILLSIVLVFFLGFFAKMTWFG